MKKRARIILWLSTLLVLLGAGAVWLLLGGVSNPAGRHAIGEMIPPMGVRRVDVVPVCFGEFLREFPLQKRGAHMKYHDGILSYGQSFGYAILNLPMTSN